MRGELAATGRAAAAVERRRALAALIDAWRDLARDLAVAARGDGRAVRDRDQLPSSRTVAAPPRPASAACASSTASTGSGWRSRAYANPELVLDALLLAWPRRSEHRRHCRGMSDATVSQRRVVAVVHGVVQGVGFRWFVQREASRLGLTGWTANLVDGTVEVVAEGPEVELERSWRSSGRGHRRLREPGRCTPRSPRAGDLSDFAIRSGAHRGD